MEIPENFDINLFHVLNDVYDSKIDRDENTIGCSSLSSCARTTIIKKIHGIKTPPNPKMLMGHIMGEALARPKSAFKIIDMINEQFGIKGLIEITAEPVLKYEVAPGKFLEGHIDLNTNLYPIEIKTTWVYVREWVKEIAARYFIQANAYLGIQKKNVGFVATLNMRAFMAKFHSWKELWEKYGYFIPFYFNQNTFDASIEKVRFIFKQIEKKDPDVECHPESWECRLCDVRDLCGKVLGKCKHVNKNGKVCGKEMYEWVECLTKEFLDEPLCQNCYEKKTLKRKPYEIYKYSKTFPYLPKTFPYLPNK